MSAANWIITDISTAPIVGAVDYMGPVVANRTLKDPEKIAADIAKKERERGEGIFDIDLLRITGIGLLTPTSTDDAVMVIECHNEADERDALEDLAGRMRTDLGVRRTLVGFNALAFDWPVLRRRARYLGVKFPEIVCSPAWKASDLDLFAKLKDEGGAKSLGFYVRRLGWTDLEKPLSGAEEARVHETGEWEKLRASLRHDVTATARLGRWMGLL